MTRIGVCGGPYGNPGALEAFVVDARARGCERLYCLGDLGGFGPDADALRPLLEEAGVSCIAGNYDVALARADPDCGCGYRDATDNAFAQLIYDHTLATTDRGFAAWMGAQPTERRERVDGVDVHMVHGSPLTLNDFWWESLGEDEHRLRVAASGADVVLCTHSGLPWQRRVAGTLVVNVGVLGKPANDGTPDVWYAVLDCEDGRSSAELVPLAYDWQAHAASMRAAGLPEAFVETVETGWWTTCLEVLPPLERSRGRYQLYRSTLPASFSPADAGWGDGAAPAEDPGGAQRPVVPLFGSAYFPSRLWLYTNFHCNLACDYCAVASSPQAPARLLELEEVERRLDEAVAEGFTEVFLTGGEPMMHPRIGEVLRAAATRLPTTVLSNAMLVRGRRRQALAGLADLPLTVQTSLDGARAATHDAHRGAGSFRRTVEGITALVDLGLVPRVALTETPENSAEVADVGALLLGLGVPEDHFAVRPLLRRGFSKTGLDIEESTSIPELTVTADGLHWHPAGADLGSSPDLWLAPPGTPLAEGRRMVVERFFGARLADGSLPHPIHCAV